MSLDAATVAAVSGALVAVLGAMTAMAVAIIRELRATRTSMEQADATKIEISQKIAEGAQPVKELSPEVVALAQKLQALIDAQP